MENVEILKSVLSEETYGKVVEETKKSEMKLFDLSGGEYVSKSKYDALDEQLKRTQNLLDAKTQDYDTLKSKAGDNTALQETIDQMKSDHKREITEIQSRHDAQLLANDTAVHIIQKYKPKDVSDVMRHIDMEKVSRKGETLIGVDEQVDAIKEAKAYYFESESTEPNSKPNSKAGGLPHGGSENDNSALRAAFGLKDTNTTEKAKEN